MKYLVIFLLFLLVPAQAWFWGAWGSFFQHQQPQKPAQKQGGKNSTAKADPNSWLPKYLNYIQKTFSSGGGGGGEGGGGGGGKGGGGK